MTMTIIDRPILRAHELVVQFVWDVTGLSRVTLMRSVAMVCVSFTFLHSIQTYGSIGLFDLFFAAILIGIQALEEFSRQMHGKNINAHKEIVQGRPINMFLRTFVLTLSAYRIIGNIVDPLTGVIAFHAWPIGAELSFVVFYYLGECKEPTEPPKFRGRQMHLAPSLG